MQTSWRTVSQAEAMASSNVLTQEMVIIFENQQRDSCHGNAMRKLESGRKLGGLGLNIRRYGQVLHATVRTWL